MRLFWMLLFFALTNPAFSQQDAKKTFERLKTLDREWQGSMRTTPVVPDVARLRLTSVMPRGVTAEVEMPVQT